MEKFEAKIVIPKVDATTDVSQYLSWLYYSLSDVCEELKMCCNLIRMAESMRDIKETDLDTGTLEFRTLYSTLLAKEHILKIAVNGDNGLIDNLKRLDEFIEDIAEQSNNILIKEEDCQK